MDSYGILDSLPIEYGILHQLSGVPRFAGVPAQVSPRSRSGTRRAPQVKHGKAEHGKYMGEAWRSLSGTNNAKTLDIFRCMNVRCSCFMCVFCTLLSIVPFWNLSTGSTFHGPVWAALVCDWQKVMPVSSAVAAPCNRKGCAAFVASSLYNI